MTPEASCYGAAKPADGDGKVRRSREALMPPSHAPEPPRPISKVHQAPWLTPGQLEVGPGAGGASAQPADTAAASTPSSGASPPLPDHSRGGTEASPEASRAEALSLANAPHRPFNPATSLAVGTKKGGGGGGGDDAGAGKSNGKDKGEEGKQPVGPEFAIWDFRPSVQPVEPPCPCTCKCIDAVVTEKVSVVAMVLDGVATLGRTSNPWTPLVDIFDLWRMGPLLATPNASYGGIDPVAAETLRVEPAEAVLVAANTAGVQAWQSGNAQTAWVGPLGLVAASLPPMSGLGTSSPPSSVPALAGAAGTPGSDLRWDPPNPLPGEEPPEWRPWHPGGGLPPDPSLPVANFSPGRFSIPKFWWGPTLRFSSMQFPVEPPDEGDGGGPAGGGGGGGDHGQGLDLNLDELRESIRAEMLAKAKEQQPRPVVEPPHQLVPAAGPSVTIPPTPGPPVTIKRTAIDRSSKAERPNAGVTRAPGSVGGPEDPARAAKMEQEARSMAVRGQDQATRRAQMLERLQPLESVQGDNSKARNPGETAIDVSAAEMRDAARSALVDSAMSPPAALREQYSAAGANPPQSGTGIGGRSPLQRVASGGEVAPPRLTRAQLRLGDVVADPARTVSSPELATLDDGEAVTPTSNEAVSRSPVQPMGRADARGTPRDASARSEASAHPSVVTPDATVATSQGSSLHGAAASRSAQYPASAAAGVGARPVGGARRSDPFQFTSVSGPSRRGGGGGGGAPPGTYELVAAMQGVQNSRELRDAAGPRVDASARSAGRDILTALDGVGSDGPPVQGLSRAGAESRGGYALDVLGPVAGRAPEAPTKPTRPVKPRRPSRADGYAKLTGEDKREADRQYKQDLRAYDDSLKNYQADVKSYPKRYRDFAHAKSQYEADYAIYESEKRDRSVRQGLVEDLERGAARADTAQDACVESVGDLVSAKQAIVDKYGEEGLAQAVHAAEQIVDRQLKSQDARSVGNKARASARLVKLADGMSSAVEKAVSSVPPGERDAATKAAYQTQADQLLGAAADLLFQGYTSDRLNDTDGHPLDLMNLAQAELELEYAESVQGQRAAREAGRRVAQHEKTLRALDKQAHALDKRIDKLEGVSNPSDAQKDALKKLKEERDALKQQREGTEEKLAHDKRVAGQERAARSRVKALKRLQKRSKLTKAQQRARDRVLEALSEARRNGAELPDWVNDEVDKWEQENPDKVPPPEPAPGDPQPGPGGAGGKGANNAGGGAQQPNANVDPGCESCKPPKKCPEGPYECTSKDKPVEPDHQKPEQPLDPTGKGNYSKPEGLVLPDIPRPDLGGPVRPPPAKPGDTESTVETPPAKSDVGPPKRPVVAPPDSAVPQIPSNSGAPPLKDNPCKQVLADALEAHNAGAGTDEPAPEWALLKILHQVGDTLRECGAIDDVGPRPSLTGLSTDPLPQSQEILSSDSLATKVLKAAWNIGVKIPRGAGRDPLATLVKVNYRIEQHRFYGATLPPAELQALIDYCENYQHHLAVYHAQIADLYARAAVLVALAKLLCFVDSVKDTAWYDLSGKLTNVIEDIAAPVYATVEAYVERVEREGHGDVISDHLRSTIAWLQGLVRHYAALRTWLGFGEMGLSVVSLFQWAARAFLLARLAAARAAGDRRSGG
ncbi:MAG: hypothetical protein H6826_13940 [Planctomycetes bacterium]|nr:hypothetical protein [Planctomycetota bacterium]MCB9902440.1 hypothetical protein [Planctomycetota bacterium]